MQKSATKSAINVDTKIDVLKESIKYFKKSFEPHDCGWMNTTIGGLEHYIKVLRDVKKGKTPKHWSEYL